MSDETTFGWLSVYLYYNEPWEEFLKKAVQPIVETAMKNGIADQFFFVRYWDRGPHVRLRFKGDEQICSELLQPNLTEHFQNYFDSKPSNRIDPHYPINFPDEFKWYPNNSLHYVDYEPEYDRYGGVYGTQLAEKQFQASSTFVLNEIKRISHLWSYEDAMGTAIKMHLSFIYLMDLDLEESITFFGDLFSNWLPHSFYHHRKLSNQEHQEKSLETIDAFEENFDKQKDALIPFLNTLWSSLEAGDLFDDDAFNEWIAFCKLFKSEMNHMINSRRVIDRTDKYVFNSKKPLSKKQTLLHGLFSDYIHMTNNRLGILNRDEGYLAFLIRNGLKAYQAKEIDKVSVKSTQV